MAQQLLQQAPQQSPHQMPRSVQYPFSSAQQATPAHLFHHRWAQVAELHRDMRLRVASTPLALCHEFDRAFPSPARLMAFWQESGAQDYQTWGLSMTMACGLWSTGRIDGAVDHAGPQVVALRGLIEVFARHVSEQARWTDGAGVEYVLQQQAPDGLWSSIPHWAEDIQQVHRSVHAGYLHGQARWAVAIGDGMEPSFLCGIDAQGRPLSASAVAHQVKLVQGYELTGRQPLIHRFRA
jgi:hypothetical protein